MPQSCNMTTDCNDRRIGWTTSILLHILLLLIFVLSRLDIRPFELTFTRIEFAPLSTYKADEGSVLASLESGKPIVELPRRSMLEDESPLLRLPDRPKPIIEAVAPHERPEIVDRVTTQTGRRITLPTEAKGLRERPVIEPLPVADDWLAGERSQALSEKVAGDEMFSISWEGAARTKLSGALPTFPPGVQRAATIILSFEVSPAGEVVRAAPVTKGVPELEKAALDALRTWRFNTLDPALQQVNQRGEIKFVFKLK